MALADNAIIKNTNEVWDYVGSVEDDRNLFEPLMEGWINAASNLLERLCNRRIVARTYCGVAQDGNGRRFLYLDNYPLLNFDSLTIFDRDFLVEYVIDVDNAIDINKETGRITIRAQSPQIGTFIHGFENIVMTYRAGFDGPELEPFKDAVKDLISMRWQKKGDDPTALVRSDNLGTSVSTTFFDPRRLPAITQQVVYMYRKLEV